MSSLIHLKPKGPDVAIEAARWTEVHERCRDVIVGQDELLESLLLALLADGHVLLEGLPGLAKTLSVQCLAALVHGEFKRVQFTPDLLPADVVGTLIYRPQDGEFTTRHGPVFTNLLLADEINRAPAKVQSALLEAMQERQVTLGETTHPLPKPFLVLATQNPIEQEGTYPLPEAQLDRFLLKVTVDYPQRAHEREILERASTPGALDPHALRPVLDLEHVLAARKVVEQIYVDGRVKDYMVDLVQATREPRAYGVDLEGLAECRASPRATLGLLRASRAHAFLHGRGYVTPEDVKAVAPRVLRHRLTPTYEAEAQELTADDLVARVLTRVRVP
ncbi:MAG: AAA family ATPase [Planctomycetota bacterium]